MRVAPIRLIAGRAHYDTVVEAVMRARRSVWIATANVKELMVRDDRVRPGRARSRGASYRSVLAAFDELARRDVELRLLHARTPSLAFREELGRHARLAGGALEMRLCPRVHLKAVVVDAELLYLGSANWTGAGLGVKGSERRNFEVGIVTTDDALIDDVQALYESIWTGAPCARCRLRHLCPAPLDGVAELRCT